MNKWITWISKLRYVIIAAWILMAAISVIVLPDLPSIVRNTEQKFLPANSKSVQASKLLQQIDPSSRSLSNAVITLSREEGLTAADKKWMNQLLLHIDAKKATLGITSLITSHLHPELAERLQSRDGTTIIAIINLPEADFEDQTKTTLAELNLLLSDAPGGTLAALTGSAALSQDLQLTAQSGLRRTEILTVGIVLVILLLIFRSPVTPLIPLLTISISLLVSRGLLAISATYGLPVSHFTESFLIAVLFGAGTDYCILLIQRYREELAVDPDSNRIDAMTRTMAGVGKTMIYSASTVFTAFLLMGFAKFGLYRSAVGVAIGMLITLCASLTLAPAMLLLFGKALFWPLRYNGSHKQEGSNLWGILSRITAKRSVIVLLAAVILLTPLTLLYKGQRSYDDLSEIDSSLGSIVGFRQVESAFGSGELFPVTFAITSTQSMRTLSGLAALEQASSEVARAEGVAEVRSAVRPLGRAPEKAPVTDSHQTTFTDTILNTLKNQQQSLAESLQLIAVGVAPFSQGLFGIWPAIWQLEDGIRHLMVTQLITLKASFEDNQSAEQPQTNEPPAYSRNDEALNYYISPDGLITKIEALLLVNPYSTEAMNQIAPLTEKLRKSLSTTAIANPLVFTTGVSAKYYELREVSYDDFLRNGLLVLIGIAFILFVMLRSLLAPLYVLLSLVFNYFITMGITEFLFVQLLGYSGLSWTVSFFVFLILVALGVDYSIFLMARFKEEYRPGGTTSAMNKAMRTTGGIIGCAAIIMAGTFGALSFSGVATLVQIGVGTIIGLILYATVFMGLIIPASSFLFGELNWWPFRRNKNPE